MERSDYPAMLGALSPDQAVEVLNQRVSDVGKLNAEIAEWLSERRRLEENYANGLRRLARHQIHNVDLGIFSVPWTTLSAATETQADSHASLAGKIDSDVERPLRDFGKSSREMQSMSTMQGNLASMAKEVDVAQSKVDKHQGKADSNKLAHANQELEHATAQWDSQAPYVFECLQELDEARLNHLRDALTQLQTHEVDQVEKDRVSAEQCLNVLLNVEIADEIKTFAIRAVASKPQRERPVRQSTAALALSASLSASAMQSRPTLAPTMSSTSANDAHSEQTGSIQEEEKKKGPLKGLKRLSTVMGRKKDRSSKLPSQLEPRSEIPETKSKSSLFSRKKKDMQQLDSLPETPSQRPYSPLRVGSEAFEPSALQRDAADEHTTETNGIVAGAATGAALGAGLESTHIESNDVRDDFSTTQPPAFGARTSSQPTKDAEGYSLPPQTLDPITQAQQEALASSGENSALYNVNIRSAPIAEEGSDANAALVDVASKLQMQAPPAQRRAGTVRGRRDNRNSAFVAPLDVPTPSFSRAKSAENTTTLSTPPPVEDSAAPVFANTSTPTTAFSPAASTSTNTFNPTASTASGFSMLPAAPEASPFKPATRALTSENTGDNNSIRSGRSLTSTASQGHKHPDLTDTGLNVSVIETINATFDHGSIVSSSLLGEVAMAYIAPEFSTPFTTENIRFNNFSQLEKVAPNPAFVNTSANGRDGDYAINLSTLSKTQVAFKYQTRLDDGSAHAPLLITPAYKIEPTQASIIVHYSLNPSFRLNGAQSLTLSNVMLALTLDGAKATGCQSRPVGTFSRERNLIFWQLGDVTLRAGAAPEKLLVRFATESQASTGSIDARWELVGGEFGSGIEISVQSASTGSDPFADEHANIAWKPVKAVKKLTSGNYSAK